MGRPGSDRLLPFPRLDEAPRFSPDDARALARAHWALDVTASALPSERDQNFVLQATSGDRLVLKIANASEDRAMLDAQQRAMAHLSRTLSIVPRVVPAASGASIIRSARDARPPPLRLGDHVAPGSAAGNGLATPGRAARGSGARCGRRESRTRGFRPRRDPPRVLVGSHPRAPPH